jgi:hypothetical protein
MAGREQIAPGAQTAAVRCLPAHAGHVTQILPDHRTALSWVIAGALAQLLVLADAGVLHTPLLLMVGSLSWS